MDASEAADTVPEDVPDEKPDLELAPSVEEPEDLGAVVMVVNPDAVPDTIPEDVRVSKPPVEISVGVGRIVGMSVVAAGPSIRSEGILVVPTIAAMAEPSAPMALVKIPTYWEGTCE